MRRTTTILAGAEILAATLAGATAAQPLAAFAPADAAVVVGFRSDGGPIAPELAEDLARLDWQGAMETLEALGAAGGEIMQLDGNMDIGGAMLQGEPAEHAADMLESFCPSAADPLRALGESGRLPPMEALATAGLAAEGLLFTLLVRLEQPRGDDLAVLRDALRNCATSTVAAPENEGEILVFGEAAGSPALLLREDGLIVASQGADRVAEALQRSSGSGGPSLATGGQLEGLERFDEAENALFAAILPGALAPMVEVALSGAGTTPADPGGAALAARVRASLETVETLAAQISASQRAITVESLVALVPDGPDRELERLLLCPGCRVSRPFLAPAGATAIASSRLPIRELIALADSYLAAAGVEHDVRGWIGETAGLDLDADVLSWLGDELHVVQLAPIGTDLAALLYGPGQLLMVPVAGEDSARAGLDRLEQALADLATGLPGGTQVPLAVRRAEHEGTEYRRVQVALNMDVGLAVVGNHLVVARPANAIEGVIDTYEGATGALGDRRFRDATSEMPDSAQAVSVQDTSAIFTGLADLARLFAQPLAFAVHMATLSPEEESAAWVVDLQGVAPEPLPPGTLDASLQEGDRAFAGDTGEGAEHGDVYRLEGLQPNDAVTVVVESTEFDTMLYLIDANASSVLQYNDDAPDTSRSELSFTVERGRDYLVEVSSYSGGEVGAYRLVVSRAAGEEAVGPLPFEEVLELFEIPAQVLDTLADRLGTTSGYTVTDGRFLYSRQDTKLRR